MFKNLIPFSINGDLPTLAELSAAVEARPFTPCGKTQEASAGWVSPRGIAHGAAVESIGGHWILKMLTESKILPKEVIDRRVSELAAKLEEMTGRKPGKRTRKELAEQAKQELLPRAFTRRSSTFAWIDPVARMLLVDASSQARADRIASAVVGMFPRMNVHDLRVKHSVSGAMTAWLMDNEPAFFTVDRETVLEGADEGRSVVRYQNIGLDAEDVHAHVRQGRVPTRLAMTYADRVSFVLADDLRVLRIDVAPDTMFDAQAEAADEFDGNVALVTGGLSALMRALIEALGGVEVLPVEEADTARAAVDKLDSMARDNGSTISVVTAGGETVATFGEGPDPLFDQAVAVVRENNRASISLVQRHLRIGYNRAARLLESMESEGIVSAMQSNGSRTVLRMGAEA